MSFLLPRRARGQERFRPLRPRDAAKAFATYRVLGRGLQLVEIWRGPERTRRRALGLLAVSTAADALLTVLVDRASVPFEGRLAADLVDLAYWTGPGGCEVTTVAIKEAPSGVEAGIAWGAAGLALPLVSAAVSTLARRRAGRPPSPLEHLPHVGAIIGGISVRYVDSRRVGRAREVHRAALSAKEARAWLAGQNEMAMGAASIIDQLQPVAALLGEEAAGTALGQVRSGWKVSLAERTREQAIYLDSAVRLWAQLHNDHPDLSGYVDVAVAEGDGTALLTGSQAESLGRLLEARRLHGRVEVALARHRGSLPLLPGRAFDLVVNGTTLTVPADHSARVDRFNAAPTSFVFGAWASLMPIRAGDGGLPVPLALVCAGAYLASALRYLGRSPEEAATESLACALGLAALQGAVCVAGCETVRRESGAHLFHGTYGLAPAMLLYGATTSVVSRRARLSTAGAMAAIAAASYLVAERPKSVVDLATQLAYPLAGLGGIRAYAQAVARDTAELAAALGREDERAEEEAFARGRRDVLELATAALEEAEAGFAARTDLAPEVRDSVAARLGEVRRLADQLSLATRPGA